MAARNVKNSILNCGCVSPGKFLEMRQKVFIVAEAQFQDLFNPEDVEKKSVPNLQTYPSQKHGLKSTLTITIHGS